MSQTWLLLQTVEGIVVDVGWYRTTIRSFEREIFNIPNSVFSRNVVLNITRKGKEWRFYEFIGRSMPQQCSALWCLGDHWQYCMINTGMLHATDMMLLALFLGSSMLS